MIKETYSNIHVGQSTINSLKLASIPLLHQGELSHGILAEQAAMPGVILYGPPGTGKTKLVQALARECNANVLNVSNADLISKWVGESEKQVQSMFSLARKLSPCIIFIDEADSICAKRSEYDRKHERSFLSQILTDWDGFAKANAAGRFLVVMATNRPYDLDDAVLRRAPTRIAVDVPTKEGREAILRIHLRSETVSPLVDLGALAAKTENFTGSDLKNLCVKAAYCAVRERVAGLVSGASAAASASTSTSPSTSSESGGMAAREPDSGKRVLSMEHFEQALREVSPSVDPTSQYRLRRWEQSQRIVSELQTQTATISGPSLQPFDNVTYESEVRRDFTKLRSRVPRPSRWG